MLYNISYHCTLLCITVTFTLYSPTLWNLLTGVNVATNPCRVRTDDVLLFYGFAAREAVTEYLNLTSVRYSFTIW